jgi:hypothetical protein
MAALVVAGCDSTKVLEPVDGAFDDIAAFVSGLIETWRGSASTPFAQPVFLCITAFGANTTHATVLDLLPIMACTIGPVDAQAGWTFSRSPPPGAGHTDGIEYRADLRRVAALPGSDHDRQRQAVPINTQVDFASDAAA